MKHDLVRRLRWLGLGRRRPRELEASLWRVLVVWRWITLLQVGYNAWALTFKYHQPRLGPILWTAAGVALIVGWTIVATVLTNRVGYRRVVATGDLVVACTATLVSIPASNATSYPHDQGLAGLWAGAPGIAWALSDGPIAGVAAVVINLIPNIILRNGVLGDGTQQQTLLYALAVIVLGYLAILIRRTERIFAENLRLRASTAERERLSREIHDGVLQVLALVSRKGPELGGDGVALGQLAAEQEVALRKLIQSRPEAAEAYGAGGQADLKELLAELARPTHIQLSAPADPVVLPGKIAGELAAATAAALDNVRQHVGPNASAWILLEDEGDSVVVTVRDDGPGIPAGRLEEAKAQGRLGMAQSVRGRVRDVGGTVEITSAPGEGTEVEMRVPAGR